MKIKLQVDGEAKLHKELSSKIPGEMQQAKNSGFQLEVIMIMTMKEGIRLQDLRDLMMITEVKEDEVEEEEVAEEECLEEVIEHAINVTRKDIWQESVQMLRVCLATLEEVVEEVEGEEGVSAINVMSKVIWLVSVQMLMLMIVDEVEEEEDLVVGVAEPALIVTRKVTYQESVLIKVKIGIVGLIRGKEEKMEAL